jgi:hypothetical protein
MKEYKSPNRDYGRYANWLFDNYDTNYERFRHLWFPKNKFSLWYTTGGSKAYEKQDDRATVKRWYPWEGESAFLSLFTYPEEIKKAYDKKKKKEIKSVYKPLGRA